MANNAGTQPATTSAALSGWRPDFTDRLLATRSDEETIRCGEDVVVLDHAMSGDFCSLLSQELQDSGLLGSLKPSRTMGENRSQEVWQLLQGTENTATHLHPPVRGDKSLFVAREYRKRPDFASRHPHLHALITKISSTVQNAVAFHNRNADGSTATRYTLDPANTSVQVAVYPGDGSSGYVRHCDRGQNFCKHERPTHAAENSTSSQRLLTAIYYLTDNDWDASADGGALRVFGREDDTFLDIIPFRNRLVVFRSDRKEHQVMPSLRRPRTAITIWFYGTIETAKTPKVSTGPQPLPVDEASTPFTQPSGALPRIFVGIPSFRDSELVPTIKALMATARSPQRVSCGVIVQLEDEQPYDQRIWKEFTELMQLNDSIRYIRLHAKDAMGPCYARGLVKTLHRGEEYVLMIDSHMRFRLNWDEYLIQECQKAMEASQSQKVMMTTYPIGYTLPNVTPSENRGTYQVPWKFDNEGMLRQRGRLMKTRRTERMGSVPMPQHFLFAGGFNFSPAQVLHDVPYDTIGLPHLFFGEELSMAVRLFTHGYDLYAPNETVVYHLWTRSHRPPVVARTSDIEERKLRQKEESRAKVMQQLLGDPSTIGASFGLGQQRTATEFAEELGVDFAKKEFTREGILNGRLTAEDFAADTSSELHPPDTLEAKIASLDPNSKAMMTLVKFLGGMNNC